ncbi:MAG: hypothetical protein MI784_00595 [Cytophagales bacterium]|nr:hypothetical protein [Cytophagales bacterium]
MRDTTSGILEGKYIAYYRNGKIKTKGYYKNNKPALVWREFYESGQVKSEARLAEGVINGLSVVFYESGEIRCKKSYREGMLEGLWSEFYQSGTIKAAGYYKAGKRFGDWFYFGENNLAAKKETYAGNRVMVENYYRDVSKQVQSRGLVVNGKKDSTWTYWHRNGAVRAKGRMVAGARQGDWSFFSDMGLLAAKGNFEKGIREGKWLFFGARGNVKREGEFEEGLEEGKWVFYSEEGAREATVEYAEGEGEYEVRFENGAVKEKGFMKGANRSGVWRRFYPTGQLKAKITYKKDGLGKYEGYYENGNKSIDGQLRNDVKVGKWVTYDVQTGKVAGYMDHHGLSKKIHLGSSGNGSSFVRRKLERERENAERFGLEKEEYENLMIVVGLSFSSLHRGGVGFFIENNSKQKKSYRLAFSYYDSDISFFRNNKYFTQGVGVCLSQYFSMAEKKWGTVSFGHRLGLDQLRDKYTGRDSEFSGLASSRSLCKYGGMLGYRKGTACQWMIKEAEFQLNLEMQLGVDGAYQYVPNLKDQSPFGRRGDSRFLILPYLNISLSLSF